MTDERRQVQSRLPADLIDRLATRCDELGMVRNTAIQRAIEAWLEGASNDVARPKGERGPSLPVVHVRRPLQGKVIHYDDGSPDTPITASMITESVPTRTRLTIDDVRPAFTPRLKK